MPSNSEIATNISNHVGNDIVLALGAKDAEKESACAALQTDITTLTGERDTAVEERAAAESRFTVLKSEYDAHMETHVVVLPTTTTTDPIPEPPPPPPPDSGTPLHVITAANAIFPLQNMTLNGDVYESTAGVIRDPGVATILVDLRGKLADGNRLVVEFERAMFFPRNVDPVDVKENAKDYRIWAGTSTYPNNNMVFAQPYFGWYFLQVEYVGSTKWKHTPPPADGIFRRERFEFFYPTSRAGLGRVKRWLNDQQILDAVGVQFATGDANTNGLLARHFIQLHCPNWNPPAESFMKVKKNSIRYTIYAS